MILKKLHIENFGKLHDYTVELKPGLNEFYYENGFGKTTLSIFVKAMFYGMSAAREKIKMERKKYMPWHGGNFGGYIEFEQEKIFYRLTRFFGKTPESDSCELLNLSSNKTIDLKGRELGEVLFDIGKETFEMTAFFPQLDFAVISNEQISANILGLDKFKYDLANLNTAILQIKKKITEVKKYKPSKDEIANIKIKIEETQNEIKECKNRLLEIDSKIIYHQKKVLECQIVVQKEKGELNFKNKEVNLNQKCQLELSFKQEELNDLLTQLNNINKKQNEIDQKNKLFKGYMALIISGVLLAVCAIILTGFKVIPIFTTVIFAIISLCAFCVGVGLLLYAKRKFRKKIGTEIASDIEKKIALKSQEIDLIKSNISNFKEANEVDFGKLEQLNKALYDEKMQEQSLIHQKEIESQNIDNLIENLEVLKSELLNKEEMLISTEKKIDLLTKTKDFLIQANENVSLRFIGPSNSAIKEILTKFDIRNREFIVDANFDIKEVTSIGVKEQEYSSKGYQDILAFCVRIYFLKEIYKKEKPFLILDDTFVNLDDENFVRAKQVLKELEKSYQILYSCCNSRCRV